MSNERGYGRYDKRYDFGPNIRGEAKRSIEQHDAAVQTLLYASVPWLDVYNGELKYAMAEEFITSLRYGELKEQQVVDTYLSGEYDVDALLDSRLAEARAERLDSAKRVGDIAVSPVKLGVSLSECLQTGFIETQTFEMPLARSFG